MVGFVGITTAILILFLLPIVIGNFTRWPRDPKSLIPNCLLTRSPIVFITGLRSPFYFRHYWNDLPTYLVAHGYDVRVLRLPWSGTKERRIWMEKLLAQQSVHLIMDPQTAEEMAASIRSLPIRSLFIPRSRHPSLTMGRLYEKPHRLWVRAVSKAEPIALAHLGLGPREEMKRELLRFIRNEAEREWAQALSTPAENPIEDSSKA